MTTLTVEQLYFAFAGHVEPFQYEQSARTVPEWPAGTKVMDVVVNEPSGAPAHVWMIEAKDYRVITQPPKPANLGSLAETVNAKVRATMAGLAQVAWAKTGSAANRHAGEALGAGGVRVVLHLEPHPPTGTRTALFPINFPVNVLLKLRQLLRDVDLNPRVLSVANTHTSGVPWTVR